MKYKLFMSLFVVTLFLGSVMAFNTDKSLTGKNLECAVQQAEFSKCFETFGSECDFNDDGLWNLIDVGMFARMPCPSIEEPEEPEEVIKPKPKRSKSNEGVLSVHPQSDGSITYKTNAHAFKLFQGNILRWSEGFSGWVHVVNTDVGYDKMIMIQDGVGVNVK